MIHQGIVGFFDILGYQNLILNNTTKYVADLVHDSINSLPKDVIRILHNSIEGTRKEDYRKRLHQIEPLLISDSIVVLFKYTNYYTAKDIERVRDWNIFLIYVNLLQKRAFDKGFPLRGAVAAGEYYFDKVDRQSCVGKPIVAAYRLSEKLDFAGCAFTEDAEKEVRDVIQHALSLGGLKPEIMQKMLFPYTAPLKEYDEEVLLTNWYSPKDLWNEASQNVKQDIMNSFEKHNKEITKTVRRKARNTETILRHSTKKVWEF